MTEFQDTLDADRRLDILRLLVEAKGSANESVLHEGCRALGHRRGVIRETIQADIAWLAVQKLVTFELVHETVMVAELTSLGAAVANGDIEIPGVRSPSLIKKR